MEITTINDKAYFGIGLLNREANYPTIQFLKLLDMETTINRIPSIPEHYSIIMHVNYKWINVQSWKLQP